MSGNTIISLYDPETGTIKAHVSVTDLDNVDVYLRAGWGVAQGHHDPETHFINPETGRPNTHKSDATRPQVPLERQWAEVRNRRNDLLDAWRWTVMPDSPLTAEEQAEWLAWLKALQAVTKGVEAPRDVAWPEQPALRYAEGADGG